MLEGVRAKVWGSRQCAACHRKGGNKTEKDMRARAADLRSERHHAKLCAALPATPPAKVTREVLHEMRDKHPSRPLRTPTTEAAPHRCLEMRSGTHPTLL